MIARQTVHDRRFAMAPAGGLVAVVGADVPDWPNAPRISTLGHRVPETFDFRVDNRDDIAVVRLAAAQDTPGIRLAASEPRLWRPRRDRRVGLYQCSARLQGAGGQSPG